MQVISYFSKISKETEQEIALLFERISVVVNAIKNYDVLIIRSKHPITCFTEGQQSLRLFARKSIKIPCFLGWQIVFLPSTKLFFFRHKEKHCAWLISWAEVFPKILVKVMKNCLKQFQFNWVSYSCLKIYNKTLLNSLWNTRWTNYIWRLEKFQSRLLWE